MPIAEIIIRRSSRIQSFFQRQNPDYEVVEASGRLFNMNKDELSAYNIVEPTANEGDDEHKKDKKN